ncbi:MAG TPA: phospho-N-acetylmuramoyl-pentapeptide-transferase [Bacteroidales bacterium]|nr:phospho-N-acetylmuramoyl-pentapeptide-transferase [Bacteroidales bacterium]
MLYYLFEYLDKVYDVPGAGVFQFISFRAGMAVIFSLFISMITGRRIIRYLQKMQIGEVVRDLGIEGQEKKVGTPTMGGVIIIAAIIIPTLLFARLDNIYIILMLVSTIWLGFIGFVDDYIKVFKKDKGGLHGRFKILGQVTLGIIVGATLYFHESVVIREEVAVPFEFATSSEVLSLEDNDPPPATYIRESIKSTKTTIPFLKGNEFDYAVVLRFLGENYAFWAFLIFIPVVILIITAVSNGANITDGLDGLTTGTSAIIGVTLGVLAYVSGNIVFADYLNIMYIPFTGELVVFIAAFVGACIGFLWYNSYPAQVFMGDTGSLALGGIIAVFAISIRKELLIPLLCGIFFIENLSVVAQVTWFKFTKKRFGQGRRLFRMAPLHHHYQLKGYHEAKIVQRFFIVGIILAVLTVITLKLR